MTEITVKNLNDELVSDEKQSHFFITINSNKSVEEAGIQVWDEMTKLMVEQDMGNHGGMRSIINFIGENGGNYDNNIKSVSIEYATEIGAELHRYHTHIFVKIKHNSKIHIDRTMLKEMVVNYWGILGVTNPYINIRAFFSHKGLQHYMQKDLRGFLYNKRSGIKYKLNFEKNK
jgi:hypothetical protein